MCESSEKYGKLLPEKRNEILASWEKASTDGSIEHDKREKNIIENGLNWNGKYYPYLNKNILEVTSDDVGVIPELMVWDHNALLCGLIDFPIFDKGVIHILDYKTNKKIEKTGFMGRTMTGPFRAHQDCNFSKYSAQLYGYQKMACDLTGFKQGECWIISTSSIEHDRKKDSYIECINMSKEINEAFKAFNKI